MVQEVANPRSWVYGVFREPHFLRLLGLFGPDLEGQRWHVYMAPLGQWFLNLFELTGSFENRMKALKIIVMVANIFEHSSLKVCTYMTPFDRLR